MRRLPEGPTEFAAEVAARQPRGAGQVVYAERLEVPRVGKVPGPEQMAGAGDELHGQQYREVSFGLSDGWRSRLRLVLGLR